MERIRVFVEDDWSQVWPIIREIVRAEETFPYDPAMTAAEAHDLWIELPPGLTVVAVDGDRVLAPPAWEPTTQAQDRMSQRQASW
jgi:hypothetical protein